MFVSKTQTCWTWVAKTSLPFLDGVVPFHRSAFSSKHLFIEMPFHRTYIGVPFHWTCIRCAHSPNEVTINSFIFYEKAPSGFSPNAPLRHLFTCISGSQSRISFNVCWIDPWWTMIFEIGNHLCWFGENVLLPCAQSRMKLLLLGMIGPCPSIPNLQSDLL